MKTIIINGKEYKLKYSIRALFVWEAVTGRRFALETTMDSYLLFYSMLLSSNKECGMTFEQFLDYIDEDPTIVTQIQEIYLEQPEIERITSIEDSTKNVENP